MNKKFSTLMAGLMLASAFSVNAQTGLEKYEDGKYYLLAAKKAGALANEKPSYISVSSDAGSTYGQLYLDSDVKGLKETRNSLWKVTVTQEKVGDTPKYSFVNVATGQILSVATPTEKVGNAYTSLSSQYVSGSFMEWYAGLSSTSVNKANGETFMSYVGKNDVVYLTAGTMALLNGGPCVDVNRGSVKDAEENGLHIYPARAEVVSLDANELNHELIMNNEIDDKATFSLSFNKEVTEGAENLFSSTPLRAKQVYRYTKDGATPTEYLYSESSTKPNGYSVDNTYGNYVRLYSKDNGYIVVDTALHVGSEAMKQLPKFTYDTPNKDVVEGNNVARMPESFNFKFAYDPFENRVLIKAEKYAKKLPSNYNNGKPVEVTGSDGNTAYTYWPETYGTSSTNNTVSDAYIRLVELSGVRELTVASDQADGTNTIAEWTRYASDLELGMNTTVTIGKGLMDYEPTTIESGLYMIQYKGSNKDKKATDNYFIANLGGAFGYAEQARNQDFDHMPAAQWYVEKQGTIETAPVKIWNREFYDNDVYNNVANRFGDNTQHQAFKGENGEVFFLAGAFNQDTLKFIPVSAASKADSLLGYKHVDEKQASVETYYLNYLHGLALDKGLNTPVATDSLVRVDENGDKIAFRLIPVIEHDSYGIQLDAKKTGVANLLRNAYYVEAYDNLKFVEDGESRYLRYDEASKKYVMSKTPKAYFLKENNCIDGTHYYALVEANVLRVSLNGLFNKVKTSAQSTVSEVELPFYAPEFAGKNVKDVKTYGQIWKEINDKDGNAGGDYLGKTNFYPLDKNGQPIITDASNVALYAYQADINGEKVILRRIKQNGSDGKYAYLNMIPNTNGIDFVSKDTRSYAGARVSVDDNTLDLTKALLSDKFTNSEIRVSTFEVAVNNSPLYRRFNGVAPETYGDAANAPLNLKFFRHNNDAEYLFENYASENKYRDGIVDNSISFLGVNNAFQFAESETRSYTMFVDTAYVRNNTRMPQYLIAVKPEVVEGDTILCDASTHQHKTPEEALACEHTQIKVGFTRAMYLFNAQDSIDNGNYDYQGKAAYGAAGYTRLAFKDAVHAQDTLYILNPGVTTEQLKEANFKNDDLFAKKIALDNNKHKNVVFQFRLIDSDNNRFLIESEAEQNGSAVLNKDLQNVCVAPMRGGWVKIQNGVPVIARFQDFNEAIRQAEVFDVNDEIKYDAVDNDEIAVEGVSVVAGNGQVTIMGAAGKNVTITNILGKVIASQVIASDNATIAVPAGIVAVAVEGEAAVKAIVK